MTTLTWETIKTRLRDGHPSNVERKGRYIPEDDMFEWVSVPCGEWYDGAQRFCDDHERLFEQDHPQGWAYYPGDVCIHGKYTGGCGPDLMCGYCEMGETQWVSRPIYTFNMRIGGGAPFKLFDYDPDDSTAEICNKIRKVTDAWEEARTLIPERFEWYFTLTAEGYWTQPTKEDA